MTAPQTYWRGMPTPVRKVRVRIGHAPSPAHWAWTLVGEDRDALAIETPEGLVLIDDEGGVGMAVVSRMYGSDGNYKRLPPDSVIVSDRA
jgi:hypothetical protein